MEHKTNCLFCGAELVYADMAQPRECVYCQRTYESNVACTSGHYVCDRCHSLPAFDLIGEFCINSHSTDPLEVALVLMRHPAVKMHGPEHHFLIPAVLLSAYYNLKGDPDRKARKISEAQKRAKNVLGGFCGFYGDCGAAVGTGIFFSLITDATPLTTDSWRLSNMMTSKSLMAIALQGGPRCCKRNTYLALAEAVRFLEEKLGVVMAANPESKCEFSDLNKECLKEECPFHPV
ncbi:MAG: DUF5714 domain-containing protein [Dehalococcoidia bacterium]|nr:DUF5714 domain-containing protein [Dehalococcoidia bacterium]